MQIMVSIAFKYTLPVLSVLALRNDAEMPTRKLEKRQEYFEDPASEKSFRVNALLVQKRRSGSVKAENLNYSAFRSACPPR